jgi:sulfide:quinone oxidoreductase
MSARSSFRVVIAGGGVAALETALALRDLAAERVTLQLVAPNAEFSYRAMSVREPFAYAAATRYPLAEIAGDVGAELVADSFARVDSDKRIAHTDSGAELPYDALVIALGARPRPAVDHALTIDDRRMDELLHGLIQDVEEGYVNSLAFVAPEPVGWPLPIYELALMTAHRASDMNAQSKITVVTPESAPLAIFGDQASQAVATLLREAGIVTISSASVEIPKSGQIVIHPGERTLQVDRVVALPQLLGPAVRGIPGDGRGFIPIDGDGQVTGVPYVYAAGDATDFAIKHGGVAAQQADTVAQSIAVLAGAAVAVRPPELEIRGMLLTGGKPLYLSARITGGSGFSSQITDEPTWAPPVKIAARHLAPYLDQRDRAAR